MIILCAIACLAGAAALSSCIPNEAGNKLVTNQYPLKVEGVPAIRVLISPKPVSSANVTTTGGYSVVMDGRLVAQSNYPLSATTITHNGNNWQLNSMYLQGRQLTIQPADKTLFRVGTMPYRGQLRICQGGLTDLNLVNVVDMESYLAGVVPKELYPGWAQETYRALAVAARTFAYYNMMTTGIGKEFDVGSGQASQVYGGFSAETDKGWYAVRTTHGQILACGSDGNEKPFLAQYSAACGGTVNPVYVIREVPNAPSVMWGGQTCNDCQNCPKYRWEPLVISKSALYGALLAAYPTTSQIGSVSQIRVINTTPSGRAVWVDVVGPNGGSVRLRAEDVRLALLRSGIPEAKKLYSMNCTIRDMGGSIGFYDGKGYGHGCGLCQWGAQGKALRGWSGEQILGFYYPGAKLFYAY